MLISSFQRPSPLSKFNSSDSVEMTEKLLQYSGVIQNPMSLLLVQTVIVSDVS